jgi:type VI secretion system protein ImpJ
VKPRKALYWHQGLFLQPQHLQYADEYGESLAYQYAALLSGAAQGIARIEIDEAALAGGLLQVTALECVLDDGVLISLPGNAILAARNLNKAPFADHPVQPVFIGLKLLSPQEDSIAFEGEDDSVARRFVCGKAQPIKDRYHRLKTTEIKTLDYSLRLLIGDERDSADDYQLLQIAQVELTGQEFALDRRYIPPVLALGASAVIRNLIRDIKNGLLSRVQLLESFKSLGHAGDSTAGLNNRMALQVLSRYVPLLAHLEEVPTLPPHYAFLCLRQLIGELSVFSAKVSVEGEARNQNQSLPGYATHNLGECFFSARELINMLLNELTINPELVVQLVKTDPQKWVGGLNKDFYDDRNMVYLTLNSASVLEDSIDHFIRHAKIGADGQVDIYARRSLPGVGLRRLSGKPMGVSGGPNTQYFAVDRSAYEWGYVMETGRLGLIWAEAPDDLLAQLVVVRG